MIIYFKKNYPQFLAFVASVSVHVFALKLILLFSPQYFESKEGIEFQVRTLTAKNNGPKNFEKAGSVNTDKVNTETAEKSVIQPLKVSDAHSLNAQSYKQNLTSLSKVPQLLHAQKISADHPDLKWAREQNIFGTVVLEISINKEGYVEIVQVVQSLNPRLDQLAMSAAREFQFTPAEIRGESVPVKILYRYQFVR